MRVKLAKRKALNYSINQLTKFRPIVEPQREWTVFIRLRLYCYMMKRKLRQILSLFARGLSVSRREKRKASGPAMPTYQFRLRFNMLKGDHINSEQEELELLQTQEGQTIRLRAGSRGTPISASSEIAILGGPYSSPEEATQAATRALESVVVWALRERLGVDFGDGILRSFITDFGKKHYERELGHPVRNDRLGIDVYESQEGLLFGSREVGVALGKNANLLEADAANLLRPPRFVRKANACRRTLWCVLL